MDEIRAAAVDAVVQVINALRDNVLIGIGILAAWIIGKLRARFVAPMQERAAFEGALEAERRHVEAAAAGVPRPTSKDKKRHAIETAKQKLPLLARTIMPGAMGRLVEDALPAVRRASGAPAAPKEEA